MYTNLPKLVIVIPLFNEELTLEHTHKQLSTIVKNLIDTQEVSPTSHLLYINDGSTDKTTQLLETLTADNHTKSLHLSHNQGHQHALLAGMLKADADYIITIDADLQDDETLIPLMLQKAKKYKYNMVQGVRINRDSDSFWKKTGAHLYYTIIKWFQPKLTPNAADYRLVDRSIISKLKKDKPSVLRTHLLKYPITIYHVYYTRKKRIFGTTKYSLGQMVKLFLYSIFDH